MTQKQVRTPREGAKARTDVETTTEPLPTLGLPAPAISRLGINLLDPTFEPAAEDSRMVELVPVVRRQTPVAKGTRWVGPMLSRRNTSNYHRHTQ